MGNFCDHLTIENVQKSFIRCAHNERKNVDENIQIWKDIEVAIESQ